ncbi:MAG: transcription termination/antitermination protein NusA [Erysipelotrichaceae bacterium]|nr:transcription termination/antitermination protein NusA [Erysipelotrichaceae bacterium]
MARYKTEEVTFIDALEKLEKERGIKKQEIIDALKEALEKSYKKLYMSSDSNVECTIDDTTGKIRIFEKRIVVDDVNDEDKEYSIEEAKEIDPKYELGDEVINEVSPEVFGRLAAIQTKQLLRQKIREIEKENLYKEFIGSKEEIITGVVDRVEEKFAIINIGRTGALLPKKLQIPGETLVEGQNIKVYVTDVEKTSKGTHIGVSRADKGLVYRLFEQEVPEIYEGKVVVKSVSREPGERSKIAVYTTDADIDPVGACVGQKGIRVRNIVAELNHEMIDIIEWNEDPRIYITNALSPAKVIQTKLDLDEKSALVVVPDNQLSLAIGKRGQNARLAARLTGWKIDIKSSSEVDELGIDLSVDPTFDEELYRLMLAESKDELVEEDEVVEDVVEEIEETTTTEDTVVETTEEDDIYIDDEPVYDDEDDDYEDESFDDDEDETFEEQPLEEIVEEEKEEVEEDKPSINIENIVIGREEDDDEYIKVVSAEDEDDEYYDDDYDDEDYYEDDYDSKYDEDIDYDQYDEYYDD